MNVCTLPLLLLMLLIFNGRALGAVPSLSIDFWFAVIVEHIFHFLFKEPFMWTMAVLLVVRHPMFLPLSSNGLTGNVCGGLPLYKKHGKKRMDTWRQRYPFPCFSDFQRHIG